MNTSRLFSERETPREFLSLHLRVDVARSNPLYWKTGFAQRLFWRAEFLRVEENKKRVAALGFGLILGGIVSLVFVLWPLS